jgi:hypothetical protein
MSWRSSRLLLLLVASTALTGTTVSPVQTSSTSAPLTVHEWGTFTSIAADDGSAETWVPQQPPGELPCFVERLPLNFKGWLPGTVRMETPVLYFYAPAPTAVDVNVRFHQGFVTEWYPTARVTPQVATLQEYRKPDFESSISWSGVTISPDLAPDFPTEPGGSHYYRARETDAVPLKIRSQTEKFLFYRGVGTFTPPIAAKIGADGRLSLTSSSGAPIGDVVLFENSGGRVGYKVLNAAGPSVTTDLPAAENEGAFPAAELERLLVTHGLYPKEATAMVNTWRDSWNEEGTRLFYFAPQAVVDDILPLDIRPRPAAVVRVFVGRLEIVTAATTHDVEAALSSGDSAALRRYGRFLQPLIQRVVARTPPEQRPALQQRVNAAYSAMAAGMTAPACR